MSELLRKRNAKTFLDWRLAQLLAGNPKLPALGGGLVVKDELVYAGVKGVRKRGNATPAGIDDRFLLGSISKPLTGYLIAQLRRSGVLFWHRTLGETWPDLIADLEQHLGPGDGPARHVAHYAATDIPALMTHTAGLDYSPGHVHGLNWKALLKAVDANVVLKLREKRKLYVRMAIRDLPYQGWSNTDGNGPPPTKYSGGCIVATAMAEKVTGKRWEELMVERVFEPLGMTRWTFDAASQANSVTDLWQHNIDGNTIKSRHIGDSSLVSHAHGPAGIVSLSIPSWGQWARRLLSSQNNTHMTKTVLDEYFGHPAPGHGFTRGGWGGGGGVYAHDGDNGWSYASARVDRNARVASLSATNISGGNQTPDVHAWREELDNVGYAWPAMEHLHESLALGEVSVSASSTAAPDGPGAEPYHPTLLADAFFRTKWQSAVATPTLTATLATEAWVKGLALCQLGQAAVQAFDLFVYRSGSALAQVFTGSTLDALTVHDGLVLKVLFDKPVRARRIELRVKSASSSPRASRLMIMTWTAARARALEVAGDGKLWICNLDGRVLTTMQDLDEPAIGLGIDTSGSGRSVRKGVAKPWVIGDNGRLWRGEPNGWFQVAGSPTLARIAVDVGDESVWTVAAADGRVRRLHDGQWSGLLGEQRALDLCAHNGRAWIVEKDSRAVFIHRSGSWGRLPGSSPLLDRVAVDEPSGTLWALAIDGRIFHRASGAESWTEHAGGGKGKEITVHRGTPYVIGMDDGLWKSIGANGWAPLPALMPRP